MGLNREKKGKYKELCERKRKEEKDKSIREIGEARSQKEVWELGNKERRNKRRKIKEGIKIEEWKEYFMGLLGGIEEKVMRGIRGDKIRGKGKRKEAWSGRR